MRCPVTQGATTQSDRAEGDGALLDQAFVESIAVVQALEAVLAAVDELDRAPPDQLARDLRDEDLAAAGRLGDAAGDHDHRAEVVAVFGDHVAGIEADANKDRRPRVSPV